MSDASEKEKDRIRKVAQILHGACKPLKVLQAIGWVPEVKEAFLAKGGS